MKKTNKIITPAVQYTAAAKKGDAAKRLRWAALHTEKEVLQKCGTAPGGLDAQAAAHAKDLYGENVLTYGRKNSAVQRLVFAFINPFTVVLLVLAVISVFTDIVFAEPGARSYATVSIITIMVLLSGVLRFVQETRSGNVAEKLGRMIRTTACVERGGTKAEIPVEEIAAGDIVHLSAGDMVPADLRVIRAKDLFVSQSALTGESEPVEKSTTPGRQTGVLTDINNLVFMGSSVVSGSAQAVAVALGNSTVLGAAAKHLNQKQPKTTFEKGVNSVSWVLIRFMLIMVPVVFFINGFTKGDWMQAALFAISIAVGLTPEMLPMIVTTSLAKGAVAMSRQKVVIKNLNAIQNLGSIDVLCTDKTGTLTRDRVVLEKHLNVDGEEDGRVLRHAFLNSYFQTGLKNLIDLAVIAKQRQSGADSLIAAYTKVDEIPFDFERRRMSVVVRDKSGKTQLVTKGAVEEMLACCAYAECGGKVCVLQDSVRRMVRSRAETLNAQGMRVIAVAQKTNPAPAGQFSAADEKDMVLIGFLAFLDPPKESAKSAIQALHACGVNVKVLTGDNDKVARAVCRQVGLSVDRILLGDDVEKLSDAALADAAEKITVFAKLSPLQKARVIRALRENGHSVGYMGDGINDAPAMQAADVGICVDTAVDIAKESASVVLLEKDLMVLERGVIEGRRTYANMIKYIKMTVSSNFGNMLSVLAASAFLPFLPMASIQLILLNLIYDVACTAISWDNVDGDYLQKPRRWDASGIGRFMLWVGPTSSVFDIATYLLMYFVLCPALSGGQLYSQLTDPAAQAAYIALFQTGWFVESMWSQALVIHMIRTPKLPFVQSRASAPVTLLTFGGIAAAALIPFTPIAAALGMTALPGVYFAWLGVFLAGYMALAMLVKKAYIRRFGGWL